MWDVKESERRRVINRFKGTLKYSTWTNRRTQACVGLRRPWRRSCRVQGSIYSVWTEDLTQPLVSTGHGRTRHLGKDADLPGGSSSTSPVPLEFLRSASQSQPQGFQVQDSRTKFLKITRFNRPWWWFWVYILCLPGLWEVNILCFFFYESLKLKFFQVRIFPRFKETSNIYSSIYVLRSLLRTE